MKQLKAYEATLSISNISVISDYRYGGLTVVTFMDSLEKWFDPKEFGRCNTVLDAEYKDITEEVDNYSEEKENQKDFMKQAFRNLVVEGVILG
mgnify:CR=1 FL=1